MPKSNSQFNPLANKVQGKQIDSLMKRLKKVEAIQALPAVSGGELLSITKTFTDSEINNIATTAVEIIPAPIAPLNLIHVVGYVVSYDAGSYNPRTIDIQYDTGIVIDSNWGSFNFSSGDSVQSHAIYGAAANQAVLEKSIQLTGSADGTGNGNLEITVYYTLATIYKPTGISDERLKDNIVILNTINGLEMATWTWNEKAAELGHTGQGFGVIAQQAQTVIPDAVIEGEDGYLRVDYSKVAKHLEMILV